MRKSLANNLKYLLKALSKCAYMHKQNRKHCQTKEEDEEKNEDSFPFLKGSFPSNVVLRYFPNVVINLNLPSKSASLVAHILFFFIGWIWTSCLVEEQISELYGMKGTAWVAKDNTTDLPNRAFNRPVSHHWLVPCLMIRNSNHYRHWRRTISDYILHIPWVWCLTTIMFISIERIKANDQRNSRAPELRQMGHIIFDRIIF